ncbi:hypothetical protein, partial [Actinomycetospora straminea]
MFMAAGGGAELIPLAVQLQSELDAGSIGNATFTLGRLVALNGGLIPGPVGRAFGLTRNGIDCLQSGFIYTQRLGQGLGGDLRRQYIERNGITPEEDLRNAWRHWFTLPAHRGGGDQPGGSGARAGNGQPNNGQPNNGQPNNGQPNNGQ